MFNNSKDLVAKKIRYHQTKSTHYYQPITTSLQLLAITTDIDGSGLFLVCLLDRHIIIGPAS